MQYLNGFVYLKQITIHDIVSTNYNNNNNNNNNIITHNCYVLTGSYIIPSPLLLPILFLFLSLELTEIYNS